MWADNADVCANQYAGTGALKTDFTRYSIAYFIAWFGPKRSLWLPIPSGIRKIPLPCRSSNGLYWLQHQNGQRCYGHPPDWEGEAPSRGCEVFVGKIPSEYFQDELVVVFEKMGKIYELRLIIDYNRCYVLFMYGDVYTPRIWEVH